VKCASCSGRTHVLESRADGVAVLRRRECVACKARAWTVEAVRGQWDAVAPGARVKRERKVSKTDVPGLKVRAAARRVIEERRDLDSVTERESERFSHDDLRRELGW